MRNGPADKAVPQALRHALYGVSEDALFPLPEAAALADASSRFRAEASVASLGDMLASLRRTEDRVGAGDVLDVSLNIARLTGALMCDSVGTVRRKLLVAAGQQAQFVAWLYADLDKYDSALEWYRRSGEQASEAGDADLVSTILSMRSHLSWGKGDAQASVALAEGAVLVPGTAPVVRSQALQQLARGLAMQGERHGIDRYF